MKYVIVSDIHGNLEALQVVKARIEAIAPERVICLGDLVGYGASPNECTEIIRDLADAVVAGNHDWGAVGKTDITYFNAYARIAITWTADHLKPSSADYLRSLDLSYVEADHFRGVHATPDHPEQWNYIFTYQQALRQFAAFSERICFVGHSHQPCIFELTDAQTVLINSDVIRLKEACRYIVNVGSVGQPRDGDPRACLCIYDASTGEVKLERIEYDVESARQKILNAGLPPVLANRLLWGE